MEVSMQLNPSEAAKAQFEKIWAEKKSEDEKVNAIVWAAVCINAGLGVIPVGINIWTFLGVTGVMIVWLGKIYGLDITNEKAAKLIRQIFLSVGMGFFMTTLGLKFFAEVLKGAGIITMGGTTVAGMALDAVLMGAITYAIGFTTKEMFKKDKTMSKEEIKNQFKRSFEEGKQKVRQRKGN
jgi:uncharacterized protein (DUF697 family)